MRAFTIHEGSRLIVHKRSSVGCSEVVPDVWVKACDCEGPSLAGDISLAHRAGDKAGTVVFTATATPGPKCTVCGAPWRKVKK